MLYISTPISASMACSAGVKRSGRRRARQYAKSSAEASTNRYATLASTETLPSWNVIASHVVPQIATQPAKTVSVLKVPADETSGAKRAMIRCDAHVSSSRSAAPADSRDRRADVHRRESKARHRAVQGRDRRLVPGAERAAEGSARRVARRDRGGARWKSGCRAVRGQPDRAQVERPARAR